MNQKMTYITFGYLLVIPQLLLVGTRFNLISIFLGVISAAFFLKALRIKQ